MPQPSCSPMALDRLSLSATFFRNHGNEIPLKWLHSGAARLSFYVLVNQNPCENVSRHRCRCCCPAPKLLSTSLVATRARGAGVGFQKAIDLVNGVWRQGGGGWRIIKYVGCMLVFRVP